MVAPGQHPSPHPSLNSHRDPLASVSLPRDPATSLPTYSQPLPDTSGPFRCGCNPSPSHRMRLDYRGLPRDTPARFLDRQFRAPVSALPLAMWYHDSSPMIQLPFSAVVLRQCSLVPGCQSRYLLFAAIPYSHLLDPAVLRSPSSC